MVTSQIDKKIINCLEKMNESSKESILQIANLYLTNEEEIWTAEEILEYNKNIDKAVEGVKKGEFIMHDALVMKMNAKYKTN